jgi:hypothetical protein
MNEFTNAVTSKSLALKLWPVERTWLLCTRFLRSFTYSLGVR